MISDHPVRHQNPQLDCTIKSDFGANEPNTLIMGGKSPPPPPHAPHPPLCWTLYQ